MFIYTYMYLIYVYTEILSLELQTDPVQSECMPELRTGRGKQFDRRDFRHIRNVCSIKEQHKLQSQRFHSAKQINKANDRCFQ